MFAVNLGVIVQGKDGMMGLSRTLHLPFAPFPGLGLYGLTTEPERPEMVAAVAWDPLESRFHVELMDCHSPEESLSELLDYYGVDWELHEPGFEQVKEV